MDISIINAHMIGTAAEPSEHVDWNTPDTATEAEWESLLGMTVDAYASISPHMIVWEA